LIPPERLKAFYVQMARIRRAEEAIVALYPEQEIRCPTHLSIGQEAVAVGICQALREQDTVLSGHRCHAHYLAKGGSVRGMFAELYGKATGCCGGKGGSMHLASPETGMLGASAIVAGTIVFALLIQLFINVGMTIGIAPVTGIPLPLVSYGGSSLLTTMILIGMLEAVHVRGRLAGSR